MTTKTKNRIENNYVRGKHTVIGRYTYTCNLDTGEILRRLTVDVGRAFLDYESHKYDLWEVVDQL